MNGQIRADARLTELAGTPNAVLVLDEVPAGLDRALCALAGVGGVERTEGPDGYPA